jgi:SAM-dependent methyltransferase
MADTSGTWDSLAPYYDQWVAPDEGDRDFYVGQALRSGGPVVELGPGTGRVTLPIARAGVRVIGVDSSPEMLEICRRRAEEERLSDMVDLRLGDFRDPPVDERVPLVICPFRSFMHLTGDADRRTALAAVRDMLAPGGRFVFDVFAPPKDSDGATGDRWIDRGPSVASRDEIDWDRRIVRVQVRTERETHELELAWLDREEWRSRLSDAGLEVYACYGWFDLRPCGASGHSVWVARAPDLQS